MDISQTSRSQIDLEASLPDLVTARARQKPEQIAMLSSAAVMTYGELERRANQLAARLRAAGVKPGDHVGVHMPHVVEAVVGFLGVLKCGAAYLPTDPEVPVTRLGMMLRGAGVKVVLTEPRAAAGLQGLPVTPLVLEPGMKSLDAFDGAPAPAAASGGSVAYLVYTSGSTGEPKGVFVPHRNVVNLCHAVQEAWQLRPEDRVHLFIPLNFDAAGQTIFTTLAAGATLVFRSETIPAPMEYSREIEKFGLTFLTLPPIYLHQWVTELVRRGARIPSTVRGVSLGGDKIALETRRLWREAGGEGIPWVNDYGPTETTVTALNHPCGDEKLEAGLSFFPVGRPLRNVRVHLLDARLQPVAKGQPGELYIAGAGVAYGYLSRPAETAERFLCDPWSTEPGARMYRTGDLARELSDGTLLFLGRVDDQVKIRGNRVELQEVELTLKRHPAIENAAVDARPDAHGDLRLIAYWIAQGQGPTERDLQAFVRDRLPDYMVPAAWVRLEALPLTPNGKVDRRALPEPQAPAPAAPAEVAAGGSCAQTLLALCAQVGVAPVALTDNFFEAGGNSLQAMQLISLLEESLKVVVPLQTIFEALTLEDIARELDVLTAESRVDSMSGEELDAMLRRMQTGS
jgi:amino acid adenylation domain-containing protein